MSDAPELLPCPFCGEGKAVEDSELQHTKKTNAIDRYERMVRCVSCGARGPAVSIQLTDLSCADQARLEWNRRVAHLPAELVARIIGRIFKLSYREPEGHTVILLRDILAWHEQQAAALEQKP